MGFDIAIEHEDLSSAIPFVPTNHSKVVSWRCVYNTRVTLGEF